MVPEALTSADRLAGLGFPADVVCVTSPDLLFRAMRGRRGLDDEPGWFLDQVFPANRATPLVTLLDGHPHTPAFLAAINNVPVTALGVSRFGQSGALDDVYRYQRHRRRQRGPRRPDPLVGRWITSPP
ncbi:hypothetical protein [Streptomyces dengpaensis]